MVMQKALMHMQEHEKRLNLHINPHHPQSYPHSEVRNMGKKQVIHRIRVVVYTSNT